MLRVALCALALAACQKRDPLFCGSHPGDPRCLDDAGVADAPPDAPPGFETIGGTVLDNLAGTGLVLEDNATDDLMIGSAGSFQFATPLEMGTPYQVTVSSQPITPSQSCEVTNGSGTANADVSDVTVSCTTNKFVVSGAVYGLNNDQSVVLQLNGGNDIMIDGNGSAGGQSFAFTSAPLASGTTFGVAIGTQPAEQTCSISGGSGMVGDGDITTVVVDCATNSYILSGNITGLDGTVTVTDGTDSVSPAANGSFAFPPLLAGTSYTVVVTTQPTYPPLAQTCTVTNGGPSTLTTNVSNVM
ncbi:MAG TPA: hypothetical protein VLX92_08595, partial [Kofleriaceae bacterium]|nr:hypothetical protein [Kofleriaceae bacterium]